MHVLKNGKNGERKIKQNRQKRRAPMGKTLEETVILSL
jgi:hypothetical protein